MELLDIKNDIPNELFDILSKDIKTLRPAQEKAIESGLLKEKNLLVCTPTASGKTLIAEFALLKRILEKKGKGVYIVPLKALASEKYHNFVERYKDVCKVAVSIGDIDKNDTRLSNYDLIITTSEKLDSLIRHHAAWVREIATIVVDEVHLLNDSKRGPTLEILLTILRRLTKAQIVCLSATIGNPKELSSWLDATLIEDTWRPVPLKKGIYFEGNVEFFD